MSPKKPTEGDTEFEATRRLIASVEELRALLADLTERDRHRVIEFAQQLRRGDDREPAPPSGRPV